MTGALGLSYMDFKSVPTGCHGGGVGREEDRHSWYGGVAFFSAGEVGAAR
jgi:hypothetical protein